MIFCIFCISYISIFRYSVALRSVAFDLRGCIIYWGSDCIPPTTPSRRPLSEMRTPNAASGIHHRGPSGGTLVAVLSCTEAIRQDKSYKIMRIYKISTII